MLGDTIAAADGVVRPSLPRARQACPRKVAVRGFEVGGLCLVMPAPGSYTGEDVVELHLPGSPLLLESLLSDLEATGARSGRSTRVVLQQRGAVGHGTMSSNIQLVRRVSAGACGS